MPRIIRAPRHYEARDRISDEEACKILNTRPSKYQLIIELHCGITSYFGLQCTI